MDGAEDANLNGTIEVKELDPNDGSDDKNIVDKDGDGLSDGLEMTIGTDPNDVDSDNDGLLDGEELDPGIDSDADGAINALDFDSDNDGLYDGTEAGSACNNPDTDLAAMKCIADGDNGQTKTGVLDVDSDNGSKSDGDEDTNRNGIVDNDETDPLFAGDDIAPPPECTDDTACGTTTSGRVCVNEKCVDGCRGTGGNGCPAEKACTSTSTTVGVCETVAPPPPPVTPEPESCACRTVSSSNGSPLGFGLGLGAVALLAMRRRRR